MKYSFNASGHKNILSRHRNTLEFTKDKDLSEKGDCIVAVGADYKLTEIKKLLKYKKLKLSMSAGRSKEEILFDANPKFNDNHEIVLRITDFVSERTLGTRSSKASKHLSRKFVQKIQNPKQKILVNIEPQIKAVVMDFDDTIEDYKLVKNKLYNHLSKILLEKYDIYPDSFFKLIDEIDLNAAHKGMHKNPNSADRHNWFKELFKFFEIKTSKKEIDFLVNEFWNVVNKHIKMFPYSIKTLKKLKKKYFLIIMSDSDGTKQIKIDRMKKLGILNLFDLILTSDDTKINKPNKKFYNLIFKKFNLKPEECMMMGDKPEVDLKLAKELGMRTVWVKHGYWAEQEGNRKFSYVDYEIKGFKKFFDDVDVL